MSVAVRRCQVTTSFFHLLKTHRYLVPDSSDVFLPRWPGVLVGDFLPRPSQNLRIQDSHSLFWAPEGRGCRFFCFFVFFSLFLV